MTQVVCELSATRTGQRGHERWAGAQEVPWDCGLEYWGIAGVSS